MRRIAREWRPAAVVAIAVIAACGRPAGEANTAAGGAGSVGQEVSAEAPARSAGTATARHQTLPLALADGRLLTQVAVPGAGTHWFIIDTAAGRSLISAALRRTLDVSPDDVSLSSVKGATGSSIMEFVRLPALRVGDATHAKPWVVVADIPDFRAYGEREVNGILGVDVLAQYDVAFDVPAGVLRLYPRDGSAEGQLASGARGVPFHSSVADGFVQFTALLHGDSVRALLDTGAQIGALNWAAAGLAGVAADSDGVRRDARGALGMSGRRIAAHRYTFERLCIGERCLPPTELRILDLPAFDAIGAKGGPAVLIGADLLHDCALLLSYSTRRLHLCD